MPEWSKGAFSKTYPSLPFQSHGFLPETADKPQTTPEHRSEVDSLSHTEQEIGENRLDSMATWP